MSGEPYPTPAPTNGGRSPQRLPAAPPSYPVLPPPQTQSNPVPSAYQHLSEPPQSPSTAVASPPAFSPPSTYGGHVTTTTLPPQSAFSDRGRAQIACLRCRSQKIKCRLDPHQTRCQSCIKKGGDCDFKTPAGTAPRTPKVRGSTDANNDPRAAKRRKPLVPYSHPHAHISMHERDPLSSKDFTPRVWEELFNIYEKHFASDFPFLHRTKFLRPIHQHLTNMSSAPGGGPIVLPRPPHTKDLLLGFLTMTARYHPGLVSNFGRTPKEVAEYFANLTQKSLFAQAPSAGSDLAADDFIPTLPVPSLERAQTLLFLGFHRWTDRKGQTGWQFIGQAWRMIQHLGYDRDQRNGHEGDIRRLARPTSSHGPNAAPEELFITREIERRTFWSCFILDRYIGCSKHRPQAIHVANIETQLPCSDDAFTQGSKVRTRFIHEDDDTYIQRAKDAANTTKKRQEKSKIWGTSAEDDEVDWEVGKRESQLSIYIRAVDHFGEIMTWSVNGGRRKEGKIPPWDPRSKVYHLIKKHEAFQSSLPKHFAMTPDNTLACIINNKIRNYISIHAIFSLCTIAIYREYVAFFPWGLAQPSGPLDEPMIDDPPPSDQPDYWIMCARKCCKAAREFGDLLTVCQTRDVMTESPIVVWTTYIVAWCVLYCHFFPAMDPDSVLSSKGKYTLWTSLCNMLREHTYKRYAMAGQYANFLMTVHRLFKEKKAEFRKAEGVSEESPGSNTSDGGLEAYIHLGIEEMHKHMGAHDDESFNGELPEAELRLGSESDFESRRSETTSPNAIFKLEDTPATTPASSGFSSVNNHRTHAGARSESHPHSSTRDLPRVGDASANEVSISSSATQNAAHERDDKWPRRSPTIGTVAITVASTTSQHAWGPAPVSSLHQHSRPDCNPANGIERHNTTPQSLHAHSRTPPGQPAYLEQLRLQGTVSVQNPDLHVLKDSESGDFDPQTFDHGNAWLWNYNFDQNENGFTGTFTHEQDFMDLQPYDGFQT